jgi:hypothetical protein
MALRGTLLRRRLRKGTEPVGGGGSTVTGTLAATIDTTVSLTAAVLATGVLANSIDVTQAATAEKILHGALANSIDTTVNATAYDGTQYGTTSVTIDTTASFTGALIHAASLANDADTSVSSTGIVTYGATLSETIDTTVTVNAVTTLVGTIAVTIDTTLTEVSTVLKHGVLTNSIDTTTTLDATAERTAQLSATIDVSTTPSAVYTVVAALSNTIDTDTYFRPLIPGEYSMLGFQFYPPIGYMDSNAGKVPLNTNLTISEEHGFVLRMGFEETASTDRNENSSVYFKLQIRKNGGSWVDASTSGTAPAAIFGDPQFEIAQGNSDIVSYSGKQRLTTRSPKWIRRIDNVAPSTGFGFSNKAVEFEWLFKSNPDQVAPGDYIDFRCLYSDLISGGYQSLHSTAYTPRVTFAAQSHPTLDQDTFRFRSDDGTETTATWLAAANTNPTNIYTGEIFRLRFLLQNSNSSVVPQHYPEAYRLEYKAVGSYPGFNQISTGTETLTSADFTPGNTAHGDLVISGDGTVMAHGIVQSGSTGSVQGTVYTYDWNGTTNAWDYRNSISAYDTTKNHRFGFSIGLDNDGSRIIIGDPYYTDTQTFQGAAYVYTSSGGAWSHEQSIYGPATNTNEWGTSVDIDDAGDTAVITEKVLDSATVYTRSGTNWSVQQTIDDPAGNGYRYANLSGDGTHLYLSPVSGSASELWTESGGTWTAESYAPVNSDSIQLNDDGSECIYFAGDRYWFYEDTGSSWSNTNYFKYVSDTHFTFVNSYGRISASDDFERIVHLATADGESAEAHTWELGDAWRVPDHAQRDYIYNQTALPDLIFTAESAITSSVTPTTQQLGAGTFEAGEIPGHASFWMLWNGGAVGETEIEYVLAAKELAAGKTIQFRITRYNGDALATYTNTPQVTFTEQPILDVLDFRGRNDDGSESAATWIEDLNVDIEQKRDAIFRVRYLLSKSVLLGASVTAKYKLQYCNLTDDTTNGYHITSNGATGGTISPEYSEAWPQLTLSGDGTRAFVAVPYFGTNQGLIRKLSRDPHDDSWTSLFYFGSNEVADFLGTRIATDHTGRYLAASAPGAGTSQQGQIYIYDTTDSTAYYITTIDCPDITNFTDFGESMGVSKDWNRLVSSCYCKTVNCTDDALRIYTYNLSATTATIVNSATLDFGPSTGNSTHNITLSGDGLVLAVETGADAIDYSRIYIYDWDDVNQEWDYREEIDGSQTNDHRGIFYPGTFMLFNYDGSKLLLGASRDKITFTLPERYTVDAPTTPYHYQNYGYILERITGTWTRIDRFHTYYGCVDWTLDEEVMVRTGDHWYTSLATRTYHKNHLWKDVGTSASSEPVRYANSTNITDGQATTQQLGSGTFVAGQVMESGDADVTWTTASTESEIEFVLELDSTYIDWGDKIGIRLVQQMDGGLYNHAAPFIIDSGYVTDPLTEMRDYRARNDDGYENAATWMQPLNTRFDTGPGSSYRIRFALEHTVQPDPLDDWNYYLQYNKNFDGTFQKGSRFEESVSNNNDFFGEGVGISGNGQVMAVGSPGRGTTGGEVYIYDLQTDDTWSKRGNITNPGAQGAEQFGCDVSLNDDGTWLVVGARGRDLASTSNAGRVYIFNWTGSAWSHLNTWSLTTVGESLQNAEFGTAVSISGDGTVVVIGAKEYDHSTYSNSGAVFIRRKVLGSWTNDGSIKLNYNNTRCGWGVCVSKDGTSLGFGIPYLGTGGTIYFADYSGGTWSLRSYGLTSPTVNDFFGIDMSMNRTGRMILVGTKAARYYIVDYDGEDTATSWNIRQSVVSEDNTEGYGESITVTPEGDKIIVGAYTFDDGTYTDKGCVYDAKAELDWVDMHTQAETSEPVQYVNTTWITDGEVTTQQLSSPDTFQAGQVRESPNFNITWNAVTQATTELEFCLITHATLSKNGDFFQYRVRQNRSNVKDIPIIETSRGYHYILEGPVYGAMSVSIDTICTPAFTLEGIINATVETYCVPEVFITGVMDATIDTSTTINYHGTWVGKTNFNPLRFKTYITGKVAVRAALAVDFGTRRNIYGRLQLNATTSPSADTLIIAYAYNFVKGQLANSIDTNTTITGTNSNNAAISATCDTYANLQGTIYNEAVTDWYIHLRQDAKGDLTKGAKCGIIIGSNVNIIATNEVLASLSSSVDSSVVVSGTIIRNAVTSSTSEVSTNLVAYIERSAKILSEAHTFVSLDGTIQTGCVLVTTTVLEKPNTTVVNEKLNITTRYC